MNQCEGQIEITDYLKSQIVSKKVMDLTAYINSHGKSQYKQIEDVIKRVCEQEKDSIELVERLTNAVSVYVLDQSMNYMDYLKKESEV